MLGFVYNYKFERPRVCMCSSAVKWIRSPGSYLSSHTFLNIGVICLTWNEKIYCSFSLFRKEKFGDYDQKAKHIYVCSFKNISSDSESVTKKYLSKTIRTLYLRIPACIYYSLIPLSDFCNCEILLWDKNVNLYFLIDIIIVGIQHSSWNFINLN